MELWIGVALVLGQMAQLLLLWRLERRARDRGEDRVADRGEEEKPDPMDEGFENLMRFSVRGRTGLEREEG